MAAKTSKELKAEVAKIDKLDLSGLNTLDDVLAAFAAAGVGIEEAADYGDGFILLKKKDQLVRKVFALAFLASKLT